MEQASLALFHHAAGFITRALATVPAHGRLPCRLVPGTQISIARAVTSRPTWRSEFGALTQITVRTGFNYELLLRY